MSSRRFFSTNPVVNKRLALTGDELFHLRKVNRAAAGDQVEVIDGQGALFVGTIDTIDKNKAVIVIEREEIKPRPAVKTIIAPSLIKKKSMSLMIEKLTELGVDEIRPVLYSRTDEKYRHSMPVKWQRIAGQSLKVNKRLWLTGIHPPVSVAGIIEFSKNTATRILLDKDGENIDGREFLFPVIAVIGPPGDLAAEERDLFLGNGFIPYNINDCILRTETAALAIAAFLKMRER
ncbi:MAG: 16S rRNA (uracil(1498)-N(3))-methyltransferase [Candidatus Aminicenantes bacterium]|nr:16S rRNA (uracil(1498)-N(3))-methyltransferase [Candidatus Aminicenantes bacterium]